MTTDDTATWQAVDWGPWPETYLLPHDPLDESTREDRGLPRTLAAVTGPDVAQTAVFDPALQHYQRAMRAGEPRFGSPETASRWYAARRRALDHALAAVAGGRWRRHLVLRGSALLAAWYGDAAREPGDLDFVVTPDTWLMGEPRTERLLRDVAAAAEAASREDDGPGAVRVDAAGARSDEIWTYDRVPGRRLVLPWHADGLPSGTVQLDFVFNEPMPAPPEYTDVPRWRAPGVHRMLAATAEVSLAWKILWLVSDAHPQVKDLYDAVLLAESTPLRAEVLIAALAASDPSWAGRRPSAEMVTDLEVDWHEFAKDYPGLAATAQDLPERLSRALEPTFAECAALPAADGHTWRARLLAPRIELWRGLAAADGMETVRERLVAQGFEPAEAIVVLREIAGPDRLTPEDAAAAFVGSLPEWGMGGYYRRNPQAVEQTLRKLREQV